MGKRQRSSAFHVDSTEDASTTFEDSAFDRNLRFVNTTQTLPPSPVKRNRPTTLADGKLNKQGLFEEADPADFFEGPQQQTPETSSNAGSKEAEEEGKKEEAKEAKKRERVSAVIPRTQGKTLLTVSGPRSARVF